MFILGFQKKNILLCLLLFISLDSIAQPLIFNINNNNKTAYQVGEQLGLEIKKSFPNIEAQYDKYLDFLFSQSLFNHLNQQALLLKKTLNAENLAEINGVAEQLELSSDDKIGDGKLSNNEFWLLQFLSDLTAINKGSAIATFNNVKQSPIIARNLDWKNNAILRQLQTMTVYTADEYSLVNIGFAGILGVVNGFNEQGLFVASIDSSAALYASQVLNGQQSTAFTLKDALKQTTEVNAARNFLSYQSYPRNQQLLFADKNKIIVIEQAHGEKGKPRTINSLLINSMPALENNTQTFILVSCFVLKTSPKNCYSSTDYYRWNRLKQLIDKNNKPLTSPILSAIMQDNTNQKQAIFNQNTLQTIIFIPLEKTLFFYGGSTVKSRTKIKPLQKLQLLSQSTTDGQKLQIEFFIIAGSIFLLILIYHFFHKPMQKSDSLVDKKRSK